jgi:hypothetical protein
MLALLRTRAAYRWDGRISILVSELLALYISFHLCPAILNTLNTTAKPVGTNSSHFPKYAVFYDASIVRKA